MDGVLEELVDEGGQGGCRVLGDDRPSEDEFKIPGGKNKCDHCYHECSTLGALRAHSKCETTHKCNRCGYECSNPSTLLTHLFLFLRNCIYSTSGFIWFFEDHNHQECKHN